MLAGRHQRVCLGRPVQRQRRADDCPHRAIGDQRPDVLDDGRVKTFETLAREKIKLVNANAARKTDAVVAYLDMMLAPEHHHHAQSIYIRKEPFRIELVKMIRQLTPPEQRQGELAEAKLDKIEAQREAVKQESMREL